MKVFFPILLLELLFTWQNRSFGQNNTDPIILKLRNELLVSKKDTTLVDISHFCSDFELNVKHKLHFSQPNLKSTLVVLREIAFSKNTSLITEMELVNEEFQEFYRQEWEILLKSNKGYCEYLGDATKLIQAIEETILSLKFAEMKLDSREKFNYYLSIQKKWYISLYLKPSKGVDEFEFFTTYYNELIANNITGAPLLEFDFIEPFLNELKHPIIDCLNYYYVDGLQNRELDIEGYVFFRILKAIDVEKNSELLSDLIQIMLNNRSISKTEVSRNTIAILKKSLPNGILEKKIIEQLKKSTESYKMNAILAASYVFRADFLDDMIMVWNYNNFTEVEKNYLIDFFKLQLTRSFLTNSQRVAIDEIVANKK